MAKKNWKDKARIDYETTDLTLAEIAKKYKKSQSTVRQASAQGKWSKNKEKNRTEIAQKIEQVKQKIIQKTIQENLEEIKNQAQRELELNLKHLKAYNLLLEKTLKCLEKGTFQVVAGKNPKIINIQNGLAEMAKASIALEKIQKGQRLAEGILSKFDQEKLALEKAKLKESENTGENIVNALRPLAETIDNDLKEYGDI